jgi:superfamily II DNA or RNA helicase
VDRWPHQEYAVNEVTSAIDAGERRLCFTSPTGGGKTLIQCDLLEWAARNGMKSALYTNRKLLTEQTIRRLTEAKIPFGVRAAGFDDYLDMDAPTQICSLQTETSRVVNSLRWSMHKADLVLVDEAHLQKAPTANKLFDKHAENGAAIVGATATPVGISHVYKRLIVAGTVSELRKCGALVPCLVHGGAEIDTRDLKPQASGEFSIGEVRKRINVPTIFGYVYPEWKRLNPDARPAILFGPGVPESAWFAKLYEDKGVSAAHIDGDNVYVDGKTISSSREARDEVLARFKAGEIKVLCNRFVLREGIDIPQVYHGILATPIGSVVSYVQIVGRILRSHPKTPDVILQDHGGNYWRHGSPNADRDWQSVWGLSDYQIGARRLNTLQEKKEPEPIVCPECGAVRMKGAECYKCGHRHDRSVRRVIQKDGQLKPMHGDVFKPRVTQQTSKSAQQWEKCFWRFRKAHCTFRQAYACYRHEHGYWLPKGLPLMPTNDMDWERRIEDVPFDRLVPKAPNLEQQERMFS